MEAGTRMGQGQGWGYKDRTLWQNWSLVLDKLDHIANLSHSINVRESCLSLPQKSPWSPALLSPFPCQHLPICHDRAVMQTLPMPESPQHRLIMGIKPSYTNGQERPCFFTLSPSVAKPYFWAHTATHLPLFSSHLSSTHTFSWKEIRNHSLLQ